MTYGELELLRIPGDSLAVLALLPESVVEAGETWKVPYWALPLLTGVESVEKGEVKCRLETVKPGEARINFSGELSGATTGAAATVRVEGHLLFDRQQKFVSELELTQSEKRVVGAVSPGLDVAARVRVTRSAIAGATRKRC